MSAGSAGPAATKPDFSNTRVEASLSLAVAARSVVIPCCAAARRHRSRTAAVATPRPAACWAATQVAARRGPHPPPGPLLGDPVTQHRDAVRDEREVEAPQDDPVLGD